MITTTRRAVVGALAAASLTLPASAVALPEVSVGSVTAHTTRADAALDRAETLFGASRDTQATSSFRASRKELGRAAAGAAKLLRQADTPAERAAAARALRAVAAARDENVERLTELLGEAEGAAERAIAAATLADTRGRDRAIAKLRSLERRGVSAKAAVGIGRAIAALSTDRDDEVAAGAEALADTEISAASKATLATAIDANLRGQVRAAAILQVLMTRLPAAAHAGLARAYSRVAAEQEAGSIALADAGDRIPEAVRPIVERAATRAAEGGRAVGEEPPAARGETPTARGDTPTHAPSSGPSRPAPGARPGR